MMSKNYVPLIRLYAVKEKELEYETSKLDSPEKVAKLAKRIIGKADREILVVLSVDSSNKPVAVEIVSIGTINETLASPREIFKHAILNNATSIFLIHNHPSGNCEPSREDRIMTRRMIQAGKLLGITVIDHIILGDTYLSLKEQGEPF